MVVLGTVTGCSGGDSQWPSPPVKIDLNHSHGPDLQGTEFSRDGKYVCVAWYHSESLSGLPLRMVFDTEGNRVHGLVNTTGKFTLEAAKAFPRILPRTSEHLLSSDIESLKACTPFGPWLTDAGGWGFNHDLTLGLRLVNPRSGYDGSKLTLPADGLTVWTAELWQLAPRERRLWSADLPPEIGVLGPVEFFARDGKPYILLAFGGCHAYILSQADGQLIETISHRGEVQPVPANRPKDWEPHSERRDSDQRGHQIAFSPSRNLLAFGQIAGKGVVVISLETPSHIVFNDDTVPELPSPAGGIWSVGRVEFAAGGNFLIVESHFGGRGTSRSYRPTVILDTRTWKRVWWENSSIISGVSLSADGKQLACFRQTRWTTKLEIGPFRQNETSRSLKEPSDDTEKK